MKHVIHLITGLGNGGAEGALYRLIENDKSSKHIVFSMTSGGKYVEKLQKIGVEVTCLNIKGLISFISGLFALRRAERRVKPVAFQSWMYHADLMISVYALLFFKRNVFWSIRHSTFEKAVTPLSIRVIVKICAFLSSFVPRKIICCSENAKAIHIEKGYKGSKFEFVANGYNFARLTFSEAKRLEFRASLGMQDNDFLIGNVARWHPQKDHQSLLSAFSQFAAGKDNVYLILVGRDMTGDNATLHKLITTYQVEKKVILYGESDDIPGVMSGIDLHVMSSSYGEAFPNVVVEAMACETPVIVTDVGDAAAIVGEHGIVTKPENVQQLSAAMAQMFKKSADKASWSTLGRDSKLWVTQEFDISKMINRFAAIWSGPN
ncbi:glycosyltransferase [Arsukibacterium indicum]|uniref:Glycosyltransferase n=1 Tax=Arsukibacterium indicum TaxID=2848612 RepID=A0ABS6MG58_9GAMM|nr:glycosyltransferase [Arsukibacterium indicum]MBV2127801.1 glycosyltransferase [Arsukibacterium indicum]